MRSPEQTDVAYFWSENPYVHWNRNLTRLAISQGLSLGDTARFFAQVHTTVSDAIIAGFTAKYRYRAWRPRTAIPQADLDGNHRRWHHVARGTGHGDTESRGGGQGASGNK